MRKPSPEKKPEETKQQIKPWRKTLNGSGTARKDTGKEIHSCRNIKHLMVLGRKVLFGNDDILEVQF